MNVKFKMPKFGRDLSVKGWFKELLMTFLGTTIRRPKMPADCWP